MPHTPSRRKTLRGIGMRLSRGWPFEAEAVERLGISCSLCAFPLQSGEILRAVKLCHLCDLSERFGEGDMCDTSVAVVWLKMVSCETGPSAYKFHKRKKKKSTDKQARRKLRLSRKPQNNLSEDCKICYFYTSIVF